MEGKNAYALFLRGRTKRDLQLLHMNMKRIESEHVLVQRRKRCFVWKRNDNIDWRREQIHVKNCGVGHKFNIKRREGEKDRVVLARFPQQRIRNISMMWRRVLHRGRNEEISRKFNTGVCHSNGSKCRKLHGINQSSLQYWPYSCENHWNTSDRMTSDCCSASLHTPPLWSRTGWLQADCWSN